MIQKSISKFQTICENWKWKKLSRNHEFLFLFSLTLDSFKNKWWKSPKDALVLKHQENDRIIPTWDKLYFLVKLTRKIIISIIFPVNIYMNITWLNYCVRDGSFAWDNNTWKKCSICIALVLNYNSEVSKLSILMRKSCLRSTKK